MNRRRRREEKGNNRPSYVALHRWFMRTEAWRDLDCVSRCVYIELSNRYAGPGTNTGRIPCSVRELSELLRIGKATAHGALQSLQEHGFIVMMKPGSFNFKVRHASEWRLTEFGCDVIGELATKDFTRWEKKKHGSATEPHRYPIPNRSVSEAERGEVENFAYGSAGDAVSENHGSSGGTLLVYQGVAHSKAPSPHQQAVSASGPQGKRASERRGMRLAVNAAEGTLRLNRGQK